MTRGGSARRLRVVHVLNSLMTGGAEMMLAKLITSADTDRFDHRVITLRGGGPVEARIRASGTQLEDAGIRGPLDAPLGAMRLARTLRAWGPDVVQGWLLQGNIAATLGASVARVRCPVLWNVRWTLYDTESETRATRSLLRVSAMMSHQPARILYNSQLSAAQHAAIGFRSTASVVIPNGFDTQRFAPSPDDRVLLRRNLGLSPSTLVVGMLARFHPMKDHENSLRAARRIVDAGIDAHFVYGGRDVDGDTPVLRDLICTLQLENRVHLLGEVEDTPRFLAGLDAYWMSSWARGIAEGFPNVLGEAMSCGIPCAATDVGDAAVLIGDTGQVVPARNPEALATAAVQLLQLSAADRAELGARARRRIEEEYALPLITARYHALYESLA